ncbi:MAG TPA: hypothetical protein VMW24_19910, partial [Sedimentisphaerales bacterium]|nr:hypothetical protein [Sedimentisphaerales bacterium]
MLNRLYKKIEHGAAELVLAGAMRRAAVLCCASVVFLTGCDVNVGGRQRPLVQHQKIQGEM